MYVAPGKAGPVHVEIAIFVDDSLQIPRVPLR
jgi:hypothetical protein